MLQEQAFITLPTGAEGDTSVRSLALSREIMTPSALNKPLLYAGHLADNERG